MEPFNKVYISEKGGEIAQKFRDFINDKNSLIEFKFTEKTEKMENYIFFDIIKFQLQNQQEVDKILIFFYFVYF
jgi:hypothetical protein